MVTSSVIAIENKGIILEKTENDFESQAVLNPGCFKIDDTVHMLYRAVDRHNVSTVGYCKIKDFKVIERLPFPVLFPEYEYEIHGLEDPRVVKLEKIFYIFYTCYDGKNALGAYATTSDFKTFEKHGVISPDILYESVPETIKGKEISQIYDSTLTSTIKLWDKDIFLFPKKINGKYAMIHRIMPSMQVVFFDAFSNLTSEFWMKHLRELSRNIVLAPKYWYETKRIGGGCPPLETGEGWLLIYHSIEESAFGNIYHASAALLDKDDPKKVLARLPNPLFSPVEEWEKRGCVHNVVFPTGAFIEKDDLVVFYGAADEKIAAKVINVRDLLVELKKNPEY